MARRSYDYTIIGSGIAGLNTALLAQEHGSVLILTKGRMEDRDALYHQGGTQGGIAAALGAGDSPALHMQDTLAAGAGLCDPDAVLVMTQYGPQIVDGLIQWGVPLDASRGQMALGREGPTLFHGSSTPGETARAGA